jgi:hypothetical protein
MSYLFVAVVVVVVVALVVAAPLSVLPLLSQPVTKAPSTSPNSTIKVYVLFISGATFDEFWKKASTFFGVFTGIPVRNVESAQKGALV